MKKYMLIDDDHDDMELFCEILAELNPAADFEYHNNGAKAMDALQHTSRLPDRIFLDINMPVMDGWGVLARLKATEKLNHIPVTMFSTSCSMQEKSRAADLGAENFLTKPHDYQVFKNALSALLT